MRRREFIATLGGAAVLPFSARAQAQPPRRVAVISNLNEAAIVSNLTAFRHELGKRGWVDGTSLAVDLRLTGGDSSRLARAAEAALAAARMELFATGRERTEQPLHRKLRTRHLSLKAFR